MEAPPGVAKSRELVSKEFSGKCTQDSLTLFFGSDYNAGPFEISCANDAEVPVSALKSVCCRFARVGFRKVPGAL